MRETAKLKKREPPQTTVKQTHRRGRQDFTICLQNNKYRKCNSLQKCLYLTDDEIKQDTQKLQTQ